MARLAGLVLPDATPVEKVPDATTAPGGKAERPNLAGDSGKAAHKRRRRLSGGDWPLIGCGVGLALVCALFPWYIFFNQERFGVRPLTFSGQPGDFTTPAAGVLPELVGERMPLALTDLPQLDFIPTGTVPDAPATIGHDLPEQPFPGDKQPYPGERQPFRLLYVENGRAMIEDEDGFWVVRRGSVLPDGSRVARFERRDGTWVLVTTDEVEVTLSRQ